MKTEKVKLSQVKVNTANPRTIREAKLNLLVQRMLVFPKMIAIRPIVVDNKMVVLGGNMRVTALNRIAGMTFEQLATIMGKTKKYQKWSQRWRERILSQWQDWLENPTVDIVEATELTEEEKKEFIIADNASFGEWDYDKLANEWEAEDLNSWGVDVWQPEPPMPQSIGSTASPSNAAELAGIENQDAAFDSTNLPPELQGQDINPDELPKITGDNETAMERVIIVYPKDRAAELAQLIGLGAIDKVVYNIDEIIPSV